MKESTKNAIFTLTSLVFAGLVLVFMAVPNVSLGGSIGSIGGTISEWSGFNFYENAAATDFMKAMLIITAIVACVTVILGILKLITDSKLCKSKGLANIVSFLYKLFAVALFVTSLLYMISVITMCNDLSGGGEGISGGFTPVYWAIILLMVFGLISAVSSFFTSATSKKKKK